MFRYLVAFLVGCLGISGLPAGGGCRGGFHLKLTPSGSFCVPCPPGTFSSSRSSSGGCDRCRAGTYSLGGFAKCIGCPRGRFGSGGSVRSACDGACSKGRWGARGSSTGLCSGPCAAGRFGDRVGMMNAHCSGWCPSGKFAPSGSTSCKHCGGNPSAAPGAGTCADDTRQTTPTPATAAPLRASATTRAPSTGASSAAASSAAAPMRVPPVQQTTTICAAGQHALDTVCVDCPNGRWSVAGTPGCTLKYSLSEGANQDQVLPGRNGLCPPGRYGSSSRIRTVCYVCPAGRWGKARSTTKSCGGPCLPGTWGGVGSSGCPRAPPHAPKAPKRQAVVKELGMGWTAKVVPRAPTRTHAVPPLGAGFTAVVGVHFCPQGQRYDASSNACRRCAPGRYRSIDLPVTSCVLCPKGHYGMGGSPTKRCSGKCAPGRYGLGGSTRPSCTAVCPPGRWGYAGGSSSLCSGACPAGRYGSGPTGSPVCSGLCRPGRYGMGSSTTKGCDGACAAGRWGNAGASSPACTAACPAGRFGFGASVESGCDGACPAGRWGRSGSIKRSCDGICPAGRYGTGASASPACSGQCPAGRWSTPGTPNSFQCYVGKDPKPKVQSLPVLHPQRVKPANVISMAISLVVVGESLTSFTKQRSAAVAASMEAALRATVVLAESSAAFSGDVDEGIRVTFVSAIAKLGAHQATQPSATVHLIAALQTGAIHLLLEGGELAKPYRDKAGKSGRLRLSTGLLSRFSAALDPAILRISEHQLSATAKLPKHKIPSAWVALAKMHARPPSAKHALGFLGAPTRPSPTRPGTGVHAMSATQPIPAADLAPSDDDTPIDADLATTGQHQWSKPFPTGVSPAGSTISAANILVCLVSVLTVSAFCDSRASTRSPSIAHPAPLVLLSRCLCSWLLSFSSAAQSREKVAAATKLLLRGTRGTSKCAAPLGAGVSRTLGGVVVAFLIRTPMTGLILCRRPARSRIPMAGGAAMA